MKFIIILFDRIKICNDGVFILKKYWVPLLKKKKLPIIIRSKEDLKAEGDRLMGTKKPHAR